MTAPISPDPIAYADFERVDIRAGTIVAAEPFPQARKPAYRLRVDFGGEIGVKTSSAQITQHYQPSDLVGRQVIAVVNLMPRRIGSFISEVLVLGLPDVEGHVMIVSPSGAVPDGSRLF